MARPTDHPARGVVAITRDPTDPVSAARPVSWAIGQLESALVRGGLVVRRENHPGVREPGVTTVHAAGRDAPGARSVMAGARNAIPRVPEAFGLGRVRSGDDEPILACGADQRGLVYALLELADRVVHAADLEGLGTGEFVVERPANAVRSVARAFCSELEDSPWFRDETFWRRYLTELVMQRVNRFSLTLGLGYNFPWRVTDAYFFFAYPFLVSVPGYPVRVPQVSDEERESNLEMLRFISREAVARGLDFQLGLWTHAHGWIDSPDAQHTIEGLGPDDHAAYCRDALQTLLELCPDVRGVTLRTHGESGIPERSWGFWRTVLDGVVRSGRDVGIDLHAKGLDEETLQIALATGRPVTVSPKYWAEHMGLPYHQAGIRGLERPQSAAREASTPQDRFSAVSEGSRPFTRYGYADFLREERSYDVVFRVWPGTQRLLLWGDPAMAAGYGRHSSIGGAQGVEWFEPLTFKGREGTGLPGSRTGYADPALAPRDDWEKFTYTYRLLGRLTFDPEASPETWRRYLRSRLGPAARAAEEALSNASRILPLVTTVHHPSASNNYYWPEIYTDMPIVSDDGDTQHHPFMDTPSPSRFGTASPLDPELFSSVAGFVDEVIAGEQSGRVSPMQVARWLLDLAERATDGLAEMESLHSRKEDPERRRWIIDVAIQAALGRFFAAKFRAATFYELFRRTRAPGLLRHADAEYRAARAAWAAAADRASGVYVDDLTFGPEPWLRGHWADRLAGIDADLARLGDMIRQTADAPGGSGNPPLEVLEPPRAVLDVSHIEPPPFVPGEAVRITLEIGPTGSGSAEAVRLRYRHTDQSEPWEELEMSGDGRTYAAGIPGDYSGSPFALQYFFVIREAGGSAWLYPGFRDDLSNQPYFVLRSQRAGTFPG